MATKNNIGIDSPNDTSHGTDTAVLTKKVLKKPHMYRVLLLNDDFTPMEFVIEVLMAVFSFSVERATQIMLNVHKTGIGECGIFSYEIAETKVYQVMNHAKKHEHPLQCVMEKK